MSNILCPIEINGYVAFEVDDTGEKKIVYAKNVSPGTKRSYRCINGHELVFVRESCSEYKNRRRCHFRHKNNVDIRTSGICKWHAEWQAEFTSIEVHHPALPGKSMKNRRADILVNNTVIELQHSRISKEEVDSRNSDYSLHGRDVAWVINGEGHVDIIETSSTYVFFSHANWIYCAFKDIEFVYVQLKDKVYRIHPASVRSGYCEISLSQAVSRDNMVAALIDNRYSTIWGDDREQEPNHEFSITLKQRGAGCGKTYESIRVIDDAKYNHKNVFMYFTKVHSAKQVIFDELLAQSSSLNVSIAPNSKTHAVSYGKAYCIPFQRPSGDTGVVYIGTIDSFTWSVCGKRPTTSKDIFLDAVREISRGCIARGEKGAVDFKGLRLCTRSLVVVDEAQDLRPEYAMALGAIVRETAADCVLIGDKLQSIWGDNNVFTFLEKKNVGLPTILDKGENHVRRFHDPRLVDFVNRMIPFQSFGLPPISRGCNIVGCRVCQEGGDSCNPVVVIQKSHDVLFVIVNHIRRLAVERGYLPGDFAIISPIVKNQKDLNELEIQINNMWLELGSDIEYRDKVIVPNGTWGPLGEYWGDADHCVLHSSEGGRPIDLLMSEQSTRIMSIHAAKGTGRRVVFVWNLTESNLKLFVPSALSVGVGSLQYESLLHVAITRQKKLLFFAWPFSKTNIIQDDIHSRLHCITGVNPCRYPVIPRYVYKSNQLTPVIGEDFDADFEKIAESIMDTADTCIIPNAVVDIDHHDMRAVCGQFTCIIKFIEMNGTRNQALAILHKFQRICEFKCLKWSPYIEALNAYKTKAQDRDVNNLVFPILEYAGCQEYIRYAETMKIILTGAQKKIIYWLHPTRALIASKLCLCPIEQLCVLHVLYAATDGLSSVFRPSTIYRVFRDYIRDGLSCISVHESCSCASLFPKTRDILNTHSNEPSKLTIFHEVIDNVNACLSKFEAKYGKVSDFKINRKIGLDLDTSALLQSTVEFLFQFGDEKLGVIKFVPNLSSLNSVTIAAEIATNLAILKKAGEEDQRIIIGNNNKDSISINNVHHFIISLNLTEVLLVDTSVIGDALFGNIYRAVSDYSLADLERFSRETYRFRKENPRDDDAEFDIVEQWISDLITINKSGEFGSIVLDIAMKSRGRNYDCTALVKQIIQDSKKLNEGYNMETQK
jgi:hypothetical protein